jgi:hypothetical protein
MKRFLSGLLIGIILSTLLTVFAASKIKSAFFNPKIAVTVDGKRIETEVISVIKEGEVNAKNYVSARDLAEAMGADVYWYGTGYTINVTTKKAGVSPTPTTAITPTPTPVKIVLDEAMLNYYEILYFLRLKAGFNVNKDMLDLVPKSVFQSMETVELYKKYFQDIFNQDTYNSLKAQGGTQALDYFLTAFTNAFAKMSQ